MEALAAIGILIDYSDTERITKDLRALSARISPPAHSDHVLEELCVGCAGICEQLLQTVDKLSVKGKQGNSELSKGVEEYLGKGKCSQS